MSLDQILNQHVISERLSTSGQPLATQFKAIADAGYKVVINLAITDSSNALAEEGNIVAACNMHYEHIPVPFDAPDAGHLQQFFKVMQSFSKEKVWLHCALNYRVSGFLYLYHRLVLKQTETEAKKVMLPTWQPNAVWQQFIDHHLKTGGL